MSKKLNTFMLLLVILAVVMTSAVRVTPVYADDGGTEPVTGESTPPAEEETPPAEEPAAATEVPATEAAAQESVPTSEPVEQSVEVVEPAVEEPVVVSEILEQLPENTELVVVNEVGEVEPLATVEAGEIIAESDPIWCPASVTNPTPGSYGCTNSYGSLNALIDDLELDAASGSPVYGGQAGVIWVEDSYNGNDNLQVEFNGTQLTNLNNHDLTVRGGWSGTSGDSSITGTSLADVSMIFTNWTGNITIRDFEINAEDNRGFGLAINNNGDITLENVSVTDTEANASGFGDGADLTSTGNVSIVNGVFNANAGNGLLVDSGGAITLNNVSAGDNALTGAALDSCNYGTTNPGLCTGTGAVTITSATGTNRFDRNGFNGLVVDSGGDITMDHSAAIANGVDGMDLMSQDDDGTGNVNLSGGTFIDNSNGMGLFITTGGSVDLMNITALSNDTGVVLLAAGPINVGSSFFGMDPLGMSRGNTWTGLHAVSSSTITLNSIVAADNGTNGAYLEAEGDITVNDSAFDRNVQFNFPADPGLYAWSNSGSITLSNASAEHNLYGAGVVLETHGTGSIVVDGGHFNGNGTFGVQAGSEDGDIHLDTVTASLNKVKGAYLKSYGLGNIFIDNSVFVENGSYGIYASASEGNIDLNFVTVRGDDGTLPADDLTDYGAVLSTGGAVAVSNSAFNLNTATGLEIVSGGQVDLNNVYTNGNGGNGVEVYSISTAAPLCQDETPVDITVNVDGGAYANNGGYGLMVKPGPAGTLVFVNPSTFGNNSLGDYLLDLSQEYKDCTPEPEEPTETKGPLIVEVPSTGGDPVEQDCDTYTGTILKLPNGTWVKVGCPFEGFSTLEEVPEEDLPSPMGAGTDFLTGIDFGLSDGEGNVLLNEDGTITISFVIPEGSRARSYSILFWDETLNDGAGGWVKLPLYEAGTRFPLNPEDPDDPRTIISGVRQAGNLVTATVNFSGMFILVSP